MKLKMVFQKWISDIYYDENLKLMHLISDEMNGTITKDENTKTIFITEKNEWTHLVRFGKTTTTKVAFLLHKNMKWMNIFLLLGHLIRKHMQIAC